MAWNAEITGKEWKDGILYVDFKYSDGPRVVTERHRIGGTVPAEWAEKTAKARLAALEAVDALDLKTGSVSAPTPENAGLAEFRQDLRRLDVVYKLVQMKVIEASDARVVNFVNKLKAEIPTYWNSI